jgi:hypothetical protein
MRTLIKNPKTILGAACLLVFAGWMEVHSVPGDTHLARVASSSLRTGSLSSHMVLNRLSAGKRNAAGSSESRRHVGNTFVLPARPVAIHPTGVAETLFYNAFPASPFEKYPSSIRPPLAS